MPYKNPRDKAAQMRRWRKKHVTMRVDTSIFDKLSRRNQTDMLFALFYDARERKKA